VRLLDRLADRYSLRQGYWEGMASGAAVYQSTWGDPNREKAIANLVSAAQDAYASNGIVFACILVRLALFSEARFQLQSLVDKRLYGTPDLAVLEHPWPGCTTGELLARMEQDVSLAGNAYVWKAAPDRLVRVPPDQITIISEETHGPAGHWREVVGYDWDPSPIQAVAPGQDDRSEQAQILPVDEVAHFTPYPDPKANFRGMSWVSPILREITADSAMTNYKLSYLEHAATPNMLVRYQQRLRPDTVDAIVERMEAKYAAGNAFRTLVLDQGADADVVGNTLEQLNYATVQGAGADRICADSGVDPVLIGLRPGGAAVVYEQAMRRLGDVTLRPLWRGVCAALQKLVPNIPPAGVRLWYDTSDIAALQESETARAQVAQVSSAALLTCVQAGFTRESSVAFLATGDVSQLQAAPEAPPPGQSGREAASTVPQGASAISDGNPSGEPPRPSRKPGPEVGNGKGPTPKQMRPLPKSMVGS
jgi:phage portal protein BeeE